MSVYRGSLLQVAPSVELNPTSPTDTWNTEYKRNKMIYLAYNNMPNESIIDSIITSSNLY